MSLTVQGAALLTPEFCEKNPQESYDKHKLLIKYTKGKGKAQKKVEKVISFKTRKQGTVSQHINICKEAYDYMIDTPTSPKLAKPVKYNKSGEVIQRAWDRLTLHERLKHHFDQIAHDLGAVSYSYEILGD